MPRLLQMGSNEKVSDFLLKAFLGSSETLFVQHVYWDANLATFVKHARAHTHTMIIHIDI